MPDRAEDEGTAGTSALEAGSDTRASASALASESLWWDNLSGSSKEETAAKAAIAMAERGRWRGPEKEAIAGCGASQQQQDSCDTPRRKLVHVIYLSAPCALLDRKERIAVCLS